MSTYIYGAGISKWSVWDMLLFNHGNDDDAFDSQEILGFVDSPSKNWK